MANQSEGQLLPQTVGNAFITSYYSVLNQDSGTLHRFYNESSVLSRPQQEGEKGTPLTTVQGMASIQQMISSLGYGNYSVEIETADSQFSLNSGVIVLVTGYLISNERRKFTQTFFLAPQNKGYYVLNDIFNYVDYVESTPGAHLAPNHVVTEPSEVADEPMPSQTTSVDVNITNANEVNIANEKEAKLTNNVLENGQDSVTENSVVADIPIESRENVAPKVVESAASVPQMDAPKKSFAALAYALNLNKDPFIVRTPAPKPKPVERPRASVTQEAPSQNNSAVEKNNVPAVKSYAIFVANLPMNATDVELEKIFKQFGSIKPKGVKVRSYKQQGNCFGFVDFESESSMQSALKASPIHLNGRELSIEERRANNDRGRFPSGRGGYRNDNFRGRENYTGGRGNYGGGPGYARNDSDKGEYRDFSGQARGNAVRNGEAHQNQNGAKIARQPAFARQPVKPVAEQAEKVVA